MTNIQLVADMLRQSLADGQRPFLTISSDSMTPLLRTGDQVGLEAVASNQLQIGDIITLEQGDHLLTHRFWGLDGNGRLQTRGDRPLTFDPPAATNQLLGRVVARRRAGKELALTNGSGHRLHRHLIWLLKTESRLLNMPLTAEKQRRLLVRLIHKKIYLWAYGSCIIGSYVTPDKGHQ